MNRVHAATTAEITSVSCAHEHQRQMQDASDEKWAFFVRAVCDVFALTIPFAADTCVPLPTVSSADFKLLCTHHLAQNNALGHEAASILCHRQSLACPGLPEGACPAACRRQTHKHASGRQMTEARALDRLRRMAPSSELTSGKRAPTSSRREPMRSNSRRCSPRPPATACAVPMTSSSCAKRWKSMLSADGRNLESSTSVLSVHHRRLALGW